MTTTTTTRRAVLAGLPAAAAVLPPATAHTSLDTIAAQLDPGTRARAYDVIVSWMNAMHDAETGAADPVFAAIEAHRQAMQGLCAVAPAWRDLSEEAAFSEACSAEQDALDEFMMTEPTTIAGCLAALEYDIRQERDDSDWTAMIAQRMRILIEAHAAFGPIA